ncbi:hypothetical protein [Notoacmeibacter ruber]|uniref:Uncharacterized protein n=1 Tax=Notoacmeibacter ruber TaxID=2670375 RepID=A0A3L7JDP0_9HYPH|nr:hypothetical protein [Notoacmeibacter ruber]RLQ88887.1 hypothetical protein D8780_12290 [Notoacmeibacter ruber]
MSAVLEFGRPPEKPILRGIDHFWTEIRKIAAANEGCFTVVEIWNTTNRTDRSTVKDYVHRLVKAGFAEETGEVRDLANGKSLTPVYRLLRSPKKTPRLNRDGSLALQGAGQQAMWNVLRGPESRAGIRAADLALCASTDIVPVTQQTASSYLKRLGAVGIVDQLRRGVWRLNPKHNSGPLPPRILRTRIVYDQNRKAAFAPILAEEDGQ